MNGIRRVPILAILFLVAILTAGSTIVLARSVMQGSEPGEENGAAERVGPDSGLIIGDDPDEDGYTGVIPFRDNIVIEPSEAASPGEEAIDWSLYMQGPQPDEDDGAAASGSIRSAAQWSDFRYINVSGSALRARDGGGWTYPGVGCLSSAAASTFFNIHLPIPHGSRIDYLRIYYYDTSGGNSTAWLTNYNGASGFADLTTVSSTGSSGYGTALSPFVNHVVDTNSNSYVLLWQASTAGPTMRLCGLRVAYRDPIS